MSKYMQVGVAILVAGSACAYAKTDLSDSNSQARAQYEKKKEEITSAGEYIRKQEGPYKGLLQSEPKQDDALSVANPK